MKICLILLLTTSQKLLNRNKKTWKVLIFKANLHQKGGWRIKKLNYISKQMKKMIRLIWTRVINRMKLKEIKKIKQIKNLKRIIIREVLAKAKSRFLKFLVKKILKQSNNTGLMSNRIYLLKGKEKIKIFLILKKKIEKWMMKVLRIVGPSMTRRLTTGHYSQALLLSVEVLKDWYLNKELMAWSISLKEDKIKKWGKQKTKNKQ